MFMGFSIRPTASTQCSSHLQANNQLVLSSAFHGVLRADGSDNLNQARLARMKYDKVAYVLQLPMFDFTE